jgi:hypothetical protein
MLAYVWRRARDALELPLYLVAISDSNGTCIVPRQLDTGNVKEVCKHVVGRGLASPVLLTVISEHDGRCASARINIKGPVVTLQ